MALAMACGAASMLHAETALNARLVFRPLTPGDITTYKLPATTQTSGGLRTVALGGPAYMELQVNSAYPDADITGVTWSLSLKPGDSKAGLVDSPLGKNVPVYEPSDRLAYKVAGRTLLRPDIAGQYTVTATIATASGQKTISQTVFGATYVGISTCVLCHSGGLAKDMANSWAKTGHASMFKNGVNGTVSDHYGPGCLSCHTVGYDANTTASNGGFTDVAAQLKWTFPTPMKAGNWDAVPDQLKNVSNIQCENCHGPGSLHAASGGTATAISVSFGSGDCGQCHDAPTHHIKSAEWNNSVHAIATSYPSGAGRESCVGCHTGSGFVARMKGSKKVDTAYTPISCQTCHEPHGQTTPDTNKHLVRNLESVTLADGTKVTDGGAGKLCMNCHKSRQNAALYAASTPGSAHFGGHHGPQADMLEGVNGFTFGQIIPSSAHWFVVEDTCVTCHMQTVGEKDPGFSRVGGHTFKARLGGDEKNAAVELVGACKKCHGPNIKTFNFALIDYDGDGKIDGVQTEVQHLLDKLSAMLPPVGTVKSQLSIDSTWTQPQLEAAYNWLMVQEDGSRGIHNTAYSVGLLQTSIAYLSTQSK